jgi:hypothetical protein
VGLRDVPGLRWPHVAALTPVRILTPVNLARRDPGRRIPPEVGAVFVRALTRIRVSLATVTTSVALPDADERKASLVRSCG